ncbi:hypothetical protein BXU11_14020 [Flavobacterium sp. LM5]|nr:hypothetical protein BXU11_14020 [Flavobacterium sp. LM5]
MITPLITKLQNCKDSSELQSIYSEILSEYDNINFPSAESKAMSKQLVTEPIEIFINEFDSEYLREQNKKLLDSIKLFDSM